MPPSGTERGPLERSVPVSSKPVPGCFASGSLDEPRRPGVVPQSATGEPIARFPADSARSDFSQTNPEELIARKRVVFLVGGPRSGTTWLQLLLSRSPHIATANETHLFTGYTRSLFSAWSQHQRNVRELGLHHLLSEEEYFDIIRNFACKVMLRILDKKPEADIILEKTPAHVLYWREILKIFPNASFLHIVRDPRSVVSSLCAAGTGWGRQWASREVLANCEIWIKYVKESKNLKEATNNFLQMTYEDLWKDGENTLMSVFSWLGVHINFDQCRKILDECRIDNLRGSRLEAAPWDLTVGPKEFYRKGGTDNWRSELTPREAFLIEHLARDLMTEFGYVAASRRKMILPLVIASRLRFGLAWRLRARQSRRETA